MSPSPEARRQSFPIHLDHPVQRKATSGIAVFGLVLGAVFLSACASTSVSTTTPATPTPATSTPASPTPAPAATPSVSPTVAQVGPPIGSITPDATIAVPKVGWLAFDGKTLWVITGLGQVARLDPATNSIGALTTIDAIAQQGERGFAVSKRGLWISDFDANLVYHVDPTSLKVVAKIPVENNPLGIWVSDDAVWVANHRGGSVTRIDPLTNKVVATIKVGEPGPGGPHAIGLGLGSVWVSAGSGPDGMGGTVVRIDPATNKVQATIEIPENASACGAFAISEQAVWTASCGDQPTLVRIDPSTNKVVATVDLGGLGSEGLIDGHPWLSLENIKDGGPGHLVRIDTASNTIDRSVSPGDTFKGGGLVVAAGSVWIVAWANEQIIRLPLAAFNP